MTRDEILEAIYSPPEELEKLYAVSAAIAVYLDEHPDDIEIAVEAEVIDKLISAHELGYLSPGR